MFLGEFGKTLPTHGMPRDLARIGLPSADDRVDIERIELDTVACATGALRGNERGAAAEKSIEHEIAAARAIEDRIRHERDGFDRRMQA
jgi:hypothetical protein